MKFYKLEDNRKIYRSDDIKALMKACMYNGSDGRIKSAAEGIYGKEQGRFYVAEENDHVYGLLGVRRVDNAYVEIMHYIVDEAHRRQGIGLGLMECVKNCERVDQIIVSCDFKMVDYYKKMGFDCQEKEDPLTFQLTYDCKLSLY